MTAQQRRMVGHGAVITIVALIAGFGLLMSPVGGFEVFPGTIIAIDLPADADAWARTHAGGLMNGLMVFVGATLLWALAVPARTAKHVYWMLAWWCAADRVRGAGFGVRRADQIDAKVAFLHHRPVRAQALEERVRILQQLLVESGSGNRRSITR